MSIENQWLEAALRGLGGVRGNIREKAQFNSEGGIETRVAIPSVVVDTQQNPRKRTRATIQMEMFGDMTADCQNRGG